MVHRGVQMDENILRHLSSKMGSEAAAVTLAKHVLYWLCDVMKLTEAKWTTKTQLQIFGGPQNKK